MICFLRKWSGFLVTRKLNWEPWTKTRRIALWSFEKLKNRQVEFSNCWLFGFLSLRMFGFSNFRVFFWIFNSDNSNASQARLSKTWICEFSTLLFETSNFRVFELANWPFRSIEIFKCSNFEFCKTLEIQIFAFVNKRDLRKLEFSTFRVFEFAKTFRIIEVFELSEAPRVRGVTRETAAY